MAYTPTNWINGDLITSEKLNHIEQGIANAPDIDTTLAVSGKAADSKAAGDAIAAVSSNIGILSNLTTTIKTNVVAAINEVNAAIPVIDNTLSIANAAADAKETGDKLTNVLSALSNIETATANDVNKALSPKTVTNGKVTEWQYKVIGGGGGASSLAELTDAAIDTPSDGQILQYDRTAEKWKNADAISQQDIADAVGDWLDDHVDPETGYVIDNSLSVEGAAADAKAAGDEIADLKSAIDFNTVTTDELFDNDSWATGYVGSTRITTVTANGDVYNPTPIKVYKGEVITIKLASTTNYFYLYYAWCDASENYTSRNGGSAKYTSSDSNYYYYETTLTAPADGYFVMSFRPGNAVYETAGSSVTGVYITTDLDSMKADISQNASDIASIETDISAINTNLSTQEYYKFPDDDTLPINVCHRGLCTAGLPENTLVAFAACKTAGWKWVESDIRFTSDGVCVMLHDESINRTARNADGTSISGTVNIADITYAQALSYDFGIYAGEQYAGIKILTLDDFLNFCSKAGLYVQIEIKNSTSFTQEMANAVWAIVQKYRMERKAAWLCSSVGGVQKFTSIDPYVPVVATNAVGYAYIDPANFDSTTSYWTQYKTGKNKVYVETLGSTLTTKELQDNYVDFCHYKGLYAGVYGIDSEAAINALTDRMDIVSGQFYKYNDVKAAGLAAIPTE